MAKFGNPFGEGNEVFITQTLHGTSNTAIDCYGAKYKANLPVYAIANGTILGRSSGGGSYCYQSVEGSDMKVWYVHTYNWVATGTKVKTGDKICEIAPKSVNGGYAEHLHLGLTPKGTNIMDYFDRGIPFRTNYADIKKSWFNGSELNWGLFKDLSYNGSTMAFKKGDNVIFSEDTNLRAGSGIKYNGKALIVKGAIGNVIGGSRQADGYEWWDIRFLDNQGWVANVGLNRLSKTTRVITQVNGKLPTLPTPEPAPDCSVQEARVLELEKGIGTLNKSIGTLELKLEACNKEKVDIQVLLKEKEAEIEDLREDLQLEQDKYATLMIEKKTIANTNMELVKKLNEFKSGRFMWVVDFLNKILPKKND